VISGMFAEDAFDGLRFEGVAERGAGGVSVDVVDLVGRDAGYLERVSHGTGAAFAFGGHTGHVEGVGGEAVADDFGEDLCAACLGELEIFEDEDACAFADDEAVAVLVEGAGGVLGVVVAGGECAHGGKARDAERGDGGFGAAGDHGVGVAALDETEGVTDSVGGGGAGCGGGLVGAAGAVFDGDVAGGEVDDGAGDEEGRDLARATVEQVDVLALDDVESADAGADVDTDTVTILVSDLEAGVLHRLGRGGESEVDEAAHFAGLFFVHEKEGVKIFDLGGKADGVASEIEGFDLGHSATAGQQALPDLRSGFADPAEKPEAGYDDATLLHLFTWPPSGSFRCNRRRP